MLLLLLPSSRFSRLWRDLGRPSSETTAGASFLLSLGGGLEVPATGTERPDRPEDCLLVRKGFDMDLLLGECHWILCGTSSQRMEQGRWMNLRVHRESH